MPHKRLRPIDAEIAEKGHLLQKTGSCLSGALFWGQIISDPEMSNFSQVQGNRVELRGGILLYAAQAIAPD